MSAYIIGGNKQKQNKWTPLYHQNIIMQLIFEIILITINIHQ